MIKTPFIINKFNLADNRAKGKDLFASNHRSFPPIQFLMLALFLILLAFFILLTALSNIETRQADEVLAFFSQEFDDQSIMTAGDDPLVSSLGDNQTAAALMAATGDLWQTAIPAANIEYISSEERLMVEAPFNTIFVQAQAVVRGDRIRLLRGIAKHLNVPVQNQNNGQYAIEITLFVDDLMNIEANPPSRGLEIERAAALAKAFMDVGFSESEIHVGLRQTAPRLPEMVRLEFLRKAPEQALPAPDIAPDLVSSPTGLL